MTFFSDLFQNKNLWKDTGASNALLSAVVLVNTVDDNDDTPLHHLVRNASTTSGCLPVLKALLTYKADVNARNEDKRTPFHLLFQTEKLRNDTDILNALLSAGADVNTEDEDGDTPLHYLMQNADTTSNCLNVLNALLKHKVNVDAKNSREETPLCVLLHNKNLWKDTDILNALLSAGADVNTEDEDDDTPLHHLMQNSDTTSSCLNVLKVLLTHKANISAGNYIDQTPLHMLLCNKNLWKDTDILNALMSAGADVNTTNGRGDTPLHHLMKNADTSNCLNVLSALLTHKADINAINRCKQTPLHLLLQNKNLLKDTDILNALLSAGADVNTADMNGNTPLHHLFQNADIASNCLNALLPFRLDINAKNKWDQTPLHVLLQNENLWKDTDVLNADVNKTDKYGETPFALTQESCIREDMSLLLVLIAEGAYVSSTAYIHDTISIKTWEDINRLIIQCEILKFQKYFLNVVSEEVLVSEFLVLDVFRNINEQGAWCHSYMTDCISELLQMMKHTYEGDFSLSTHLFNFFQNKRQLKSFPSDIIDTVLDNIAKGCYPYYGNIIKFLIHPHDFADQLSLSICSENNTELFLNSYCISAIVKFLSKKDLINLRQAAYRANEKRKL